MLWYTMYFISIRRIQSTGRTYYPQGTWTRVLGYSGARVPDMNGYPGTRIPGNVCVPGAISLTTPPRNSIKDLKSASTRVPEYLFTSGTE